jgi:hypothetical protein
MIEQPIEKRYNREITSASVYYNPYTDKTILTVIEERLNDKSTRSFTIRLEKWQMKDIRSSSSNRKPILSREEQLLFAKALETEEGKKAIKELKINKANNTLDKVIDSISSTLKSNKYKEAFRSLKSEKITGFGYDTEASLSINARDMYDHLVNAGIIKIEQPVNI